MAKPQKGSVDTELEKELKRLHRIEKAHQRLQMEHDLLKKSIQFCSDQKKKSSRS